MRTRLAPLARLTALVLTAGALVVATGAPALAGGAALDFDREWYQPGDVARASTDVSYLDWEGRAEDGPFHAYLEPIANQTEPHADWGRIAPDAIPLGQLTVEPRSAGASVSIEFTVPDVPAGGYAVTYCNDTCTDVARRSRRRLGLDRRPADRGRRARPRGRAPRTQAIADRDDGSRDVLPWIGATALVGALAFDGGRAGARRPAATRLTTARGSAAPTSGCRRGRRRTRTIPTGSAGRRRSRRRGR